MKFVTTLLALASLASPALAEQTVSGDKSNHHKLTNGEAILLISALRSLDGHMVVLKGVPGAADAPPVMVPYEFNSGTLRLRIANDLVILSEVEKTVAATRIDILREILKSMPAGTTEVKPGTPQFEEFTKQFTEALDQPVSNAAAGDLAHIKASELKLDKNEIPVTTLSALKPILDDN